MLSQVLRHMHLQLIPIICLPLIAVVFSAQTSMISNNTFLERIVSLNTSNDALSPPSSLPALAYTNSEPHYTCKLPYTPMSLNYTLGASLSKSAIGALLISAQRHIQIQLNIGHGSDRIQNVVPGQFWRYKADLVLDANDLQSERRAFTWSELFQAIDLVRYCGFDRGVYLEMFTDVYIRYTWVGSIRVKLSRGPSLGGQMKTDLIKENNHSLASNEN